MPAHYKILLQTYGVPVASLLAQWGVYVDTDRRKAPAETVVEILYRRLQIVPSEAMKQLKFDEGLDCSIRRMNQGETGSVSKEAKFYPIKLELKVPRKQKNDARQGNIKQKPLDRKWEPIPLVNGNFKMKRDGTCEQDGSESADDKENI